MLELIVRTKDSTEIGNSMRQLATNNLVDA